jgi:hypothetical protein
LAAGGFVVGGRRLLAVGRRRGAVVSAIVLVIGRVGVAIVTRKEPVDHRSDLVADRSDLITGRSDLIGGRSDVIAGRWGGLGGRRGLSDRMPDPDPVRSGDRPGWRPQQHDDTDQDRQGGPALGPAATSAHHRSVPLPPVGETNVGER